MVRTYVVCGAGRGGAVARARARGLALLRACAYFGGARTLCFSFAAAAAAAGEEVTLYASDGFSRWVATVPGRSGLCK